MRFSNISAACQLVDLTVALNNMKEEKEKLPQETEHGQQDKKHIISEEVYEPLRTMASEGDADSDESNVKSC